MKVVHRNTPIPISMIRPHPDNPRKELGDLTELAESIKANGIFQNLTVLAMDSIEEAVYTVVIGHRRLAAAELAGLDKVPCMVVEMDEKEQISTMLLENMQRSDLTVYEQAQGFQMMLDLGETQDSISEKTGFSKTTVRHRLKLLELDPEEFKKAQERQASLSDYIELEKISDPKLKNKALKAIGTSNFQWTLKEALQSEKLQKNFEEWKNYMKTVGTEIKPKDRPKYDFKCQFYAKQKLDKYCKKRIEGLEKPLYYLFDNNINFVTLLVEKKEKAPEAEPEWKIKDRERRARLDRVSEVEDRAQELRFDFVKKYAGSARHIDKLVDELIRQQPDIGDADWQHVAELCGIDIDDDDNEKFRQSSEYVYLMLKHPETLLLAILAETCDDSSFSLHDYNGNYRKNESLERWYDLLNELGYTMSDDEKKLLDGTHECFKEEN